MNYQVLARKYRPRCFEEMAGQEHVLRALINSLEQKRLHHAYLFTGTRGVGKTTIARILAKCLNCDSGITAKPCDECPSCIEITQGRSVDLIEVDAASRTRVEDTRDLLDNVQYMPTRSRFKIYLIDEVHMLSNHSFNALLKTLEEPPEHVKFLLATTDPKKLPVTVLSRCLQFNLKNMSPERIVSYLQQILATEQVKFEEAALWQLGRAADGSMRDALSLVDQAIPFSDNNMTDQAIKSMLGSVDQHEVLYLLKSLVSSDGHLLLKKIRDLSEHAPDYEAMLADLLSILHRIAVAQMVPGALDNSQGDQAVVEELATQLSKEDVQLFYQIGILGQRDLPFAPDPRSGFEMIMLRMLAFEPYDRGETEVNGAPLSTDSSSTGSSSTSSSAGDTGRPQSANSISTNPLSSGQPAKNPTSSTKRTPIAEILAQIERGGVEKNPKRAVVKANPGDSESSNVAVTAKKKEVEIEEAEGREPDSRQVETKQPRTTEISATEISAAEISAAEISAAEISAIETSTTRVDIQQAESDIENAGSPAGNRYDNTRWNELLSRISVQGVTRTLASNCILSGVENNHWRLVLNEEHASLWNRNHEHRIAKALSDILSQQISVEIEIGKTQEETPAESYQREKAEKQLQAEQAIESDSNIQALIQNFDGKLNKSSICPLDRTGEQYGE